MPRNVVTVVRRRTIRRWGSSRRARQDAVLSRLAELHRVQVRDDGGVEIAFPRSLERRAAKEQILAELAGIDPGWSRLFIVYPREGNLQKPVGSR